MSPQAPPLRNKVRLAAASLLALFSIASTGSQAVGSGPLDLLEPRFDAFVEPYEAAKVEEITFPTFTAEGKRLRPTRWRVVSGTGNERENYLATTKTGTILDFGGVWLRFSTDEGKSWSEVLPAPEQRDLYGFEGTVAVAPGGDVVASAQDYPPGVAMTFKFEAEEKKWFYGFAKLNTPFMDRPSIGIVPGPFVIGGTEVPYISVLRGGFYFSKAPWFYSFDGLNYSAPTNKLVTSAVRQVGTEGPLEVDRWGELDWIQAHEQIGISPYGRRKALAERPSFATTDPSARAPRAAFDATTLQWRSHRFGSRGPSEEETEQQDVDPLLVNDAGRTVADSRGNLHHVAVSETDIRYLLSANGGKTWNIQTFPLLPGYRIDAPTGYWRTLEVSGKHRKALLVLHAVNQSPGAELPPSDPLITRDLAYEFSFRGTTAKVERVHVLGSGRYSCLFAGSASGDFADAPCDFPSAALLPDGRAVVSFTDAAHKTPAVAIQP